MEEEEQRTIFRTTKSASSIGERHGVVCVCGGGGGELKKNRKNKEIKNDLER